MDENKIVELLQNLTTNVANMQANMATKQDLARVEAKVDGLETKVDSLDEKVEKNSGALEYIIDWVDRIDREQKNLVDIVKHTASNY